MKTTTKRWITFSTLATILIFFFTAVIHKETVKGEGQLILLELAPVDPRSLIQGDYMILNYKLLQEYYSNYHWNQSSIQPNKRGFVRLKLNENAIGEFIGLEKEKNTLGSDECYIKYYNHANGKFTIGAESFFFEEGKAESFEKAKYGGLRVDEDGNSILIGLYDQDLNLLK